MSFFVLWRRWKASCQSVIIAFWFLSISHFSNWSDRFQSRDKFVLQFPEKFFVPFAFVASSGFSFSPKTTKAPRDQIKWHMNNGVFFIFNFPQVLLLMTIVFFFSSHTAAQASHNFFFSRDPTYLLEWPRLERFVYDSQWLFVYFSSAKFYIWHVSFGRKRN